MYREADSDWPPPQRPVPPPMDDTIIYEYEGAPKSRTRRRVEAFFSRLLDRLYNRGRLPKP